MTCQALWRGRGCMNGAGTIEQRRGSPLWIGEHSGEQSHATKCKTGENRG
jgi:hypothetical protein